MTHIKPDIWQRLQEGLLGADEMDAVMQHLENCPMCQACYLETITPRFEELADLLLTDDFTARTMQQVQEMAPLSAPHTVVPLPSAVIKSRLSPAHLLRQRLVAYAVAASLTMVLTVGGVFTQLASLPRLEVKAPPPAVEPSDPTLKLAARGPLLPQVNLLPGAQQPIELPPLRLLVERSITDDAKK